MAEKDSSQRIVITGVGVAAPTPNGFTPEGFCSDLNNGRHGVRRIDDIIAGYEEAISTRIGAVLPEFDLKKLLITAGFDFDQKSIYKESRSKWDRTSQIQVYTGAQALRQARLLPAEGLKIDEKQVKSQDFGVYQGTGVAGFLNLIEIQKILDGVGKRPQVSGKDILLFLGGRSDEVTSIVFNAKDFNDTMYTECAAGLSSVDRAMDDLRLGRAKAVLAGGVEIATHPATIAAFEATKALTKETDPELAPVMLTDPEDPDVKNGLVLGEAGGSMVLETLERARWRQQKLGSKVVILAEVLGTGKSADAYHDTRPSKEGAVLAIDRALADAGVSAEELSDLLIEAHFTGTGGDISEFRAIAQRFAKEQIAAIASVKVNTGHTFGASGTLAVIAGMNAMRDKIVHGYRTMTQQNRAAETEGWPLPTRAQRVERVSKVLVNAFGFGGKNRVALLGPPPQN